MKRNALFTFAMLIISALAICFSLVFTNADVSYEYASYLKEKSASVGWGELAKDKGLGGGKIELANDSGSTTKYDKGIVAHAPSRIDYDISGKSYSHFLSYVGVNHCSSNGATGSSSVEFRLEADGVTIYSSGVMRYGDAAKKADVIIPAGTKIFSLITTDGSDGNTGDHSAWADAKFQIGELDPMTVTGLTLSSGDDNTDLPKGSTVSLSCFASRLNGETFVPQSLIYSSADESIATVSQTGLVRLVGVGTISITATAVEDGKVFSQSIDVSSYDETLKDEWTLASPDGKLSVIIKTGKYGDLSYSVVRDGVTVVEENSKIGISANECGFSDGFTFVESSEMIIDESYENYSGKTSTGRNYCREGIYCFEKAGYSFHLIFRAYDEGFAFRYTIAGKQGASVGDDLTVTGESSSFILPSKANIWSIKVSNLTDSFNHEVGYSNFKSDNMSGFLAFPILYQTGEKYVLLTEAELYGDAYVGSMTRAVGNREIRMQWAPKVFEKEVKTTCPFTSPWRMGIVGSIETIVESNLVEDVCARTEDDFSWVETGVTSWMWLTEGFQGQRDYATIKQYVDLASEMGWKYLILDEGWQPNSSKEGKRYDGYFGYFDELVRYADERGVGLIAWVLCADLDTPEEREVLKEWADKGIKGIKVDFFDSEDAAHISYYKAIYEKCAENHLIVNVHGANKPTGERQYYPNIINREAVNGEEYGGLGVQNATVWAYTRNVVGPMDITPRAYQNQSWGNTFSSQLAVNVVFECGIPCMGSKPDDYLTNPAYILYKDIPSRWDEIQYIDGTPGEYTVIARRSGSDWYVGGMNGNRTRNVDISFAFLESGKTYTAFVFKDNTRSTVACETLTVKKNDTCSLRMLNLGGFAIRIVCNDNVGRIDSVSAVASSISMKSGETVKLGYEIVESDICPENRSNFDVTDLKWTSSDESIAIVTRASVTALRKGSVTITAEPYFDPTKKITFSVTVEDDGHSLSDNIRVISPFSSEEYGYGISSAGFVQLKTTSGDTRGTLKNILASYAPEGDFSVTVKMSGLLKEYQQNAGIMLFNEKNDEVIALCNSYTDPDGDQYPSANYLGFSSTRSGSVSQYFPVKGTSIRVWYLKLEVKGNKAYAYYSFSGFSDWKSVGNPISISNISGEGLSFGLYAGSMSGGAVSKINFEELRVNGRKVALLSGESSEPPAGTEEPTESEEPVVTGASETDLPGETPDASESDVLPDTQTQPSGTGEQDDDGGSTLLLIIIIAVLVVAAGAVTAFVLVKRSKR